MILNAIIQDILSNLLLEIPDEISPENLSRRIEAVNNETNNRLEEVNENTNREIERAEETGRNARDRALSYFRNNLWAIGGFSIGAFGLIFMMGPSVTPSLLRMFGYVSTTNSSSPPQNGHQLMGTILEEIGKYFRRKK